MSDDGTIPDPTFPDRMPDQQLLERALELLYRLPGKDDNPVVALQWRWLRPHLAARVNEGPGYRLHPRNIELHAPRIPRVPAR